jgi:hypothetical protein
MLHTSDYCGADKCIHVSEKNTYSYIFYKEAPICKMPYQFEVGWPCYKISHKFSRKQTMLKEHSPTIVIRLTYRWKNENIK